MPGSSGLLSIRIRTGALRESFEAHRPPHAPGQSAHAHAVSPDRAPIRPSQAFAHARSDWTGLTAAEQKTRASAGRPKIVMQIVCQLLLSCAIVEGFAAHQAVFRKGS